MLTQISFFRKRQTAQKAVRLANFSPARHNAEHFNTRRTFVGSISTLSTVIDVLAAIQKALKLIPVNS